MQPPTNGPKHREYVKMSNFASLPGPSLTGSISSQRSYGATRADLNYTDTKFLSHKVIAGDTLQGIAVKYGVTVRREKVHFHAIIKGLQIKEFDVSSPRAKTAFQHY